MDSSRATHLVKNEKVPKESPSKPRFNKWPSFIKIWRDYFFEYCNLTSIHGFKYFGERKRSIFEKLCWVVVFLASLYMCTHLITKLYDHWESSPVVVSFAENSTPIWKIPFPAVTICPPTECTPKMFNYSDYFCKELHGQDLPANKSDYYQKLYIICGTILPRNGSFVDNYEIMHWLIEVTTPLNVSLRHCNWKSSEVSCQEFFTPILTEDGWCFTSNALTWNEIYTNNAFRPGKENINVKTSNVWTLETGFEKKVTNEEYPRRLFSSGIIQSFHFVFYDLGYDYTCKGSVQGYKALLHTPGEIPSSDRKYFLLPFNHDVLVNILPDLMTTSDSVRSYKPSQRQCYFSYERQLKFFKNYTQQNCEIECLSNFTLHICECVAYYMPHDEVTPICEFSKKQCMLDIENQLRLKQLERKNNLWRCNCLQDCTSLVYNTELTVVKIDTKIPRYQIPEYALAKRPDAISRMTKCSVYFKEGKFLRKERNELYGTIDYLAKCGGLLGLFTGFSFLSLVEIIYFLSIRLICNCLSYGRHQ